MDFALAGDGRLRFGSHNLPAVELDRGARRRVHLRATARVFRISCELEECDLTIAVGNRDRDAAARPAEQMMVDELVRNAAGVQIRPDAFVELAVVKKGDGAV